MKWNWGTGIVVGMLLFISFILFFVIKMSINEKYSHDLVTEEYYAKEMVYQNEIDAEKNTRDLLEKMESKKGTKGWQLIFPKSLDFQKIKGTVFLYRPSNKQLDFDMPIELTSQNLLIPDERLLEGRWNIIAEWTYDGKPYMYKEEINY